MMSTRTGRPWMAVALLLTVSLFAGCAAVDRTFNPITSQPEPPPALNNGQPTETLAVNDPQEKQAVMALETARTQYLYQLELMQAYYFKIGNLDKQRWSKNEWNNLNNARTWAWEGIPAIPQPAGANMAHETEHSLVEPLMTARNDYYKGVKNIIALYQSRGGADDHKLKMVVNMQERFEPVWIYPYFPELQLPPLSLRGTEEIPAAEQLYQEATGLFWGGKYFPAVANYEKERHALAKFQQLIDEYPTSRRIALSAYYIAEIYKEYFKENAICVYWYERSWTWDPHVEEPACFQAATVYDTHLKNYAKALECFRMSLSRPDPERLANRAYCEKMIEKLTGEKQ